MRWVTLVAACGVDHVELPRPPVTLDEARAAAARDYACPLERVTYRCDTRDGYELEVCGTMRRYDGAQLPIPCACDTCRVGRSCLRATVAAAWVGDGFEPDGCWRAPIDPELGLVVVDGRVSIKIDRAMKLPCDKPHLAIGVDRRWFRVCGAASAGVIATDLVLGAGPHDLELARTDGTTCTRMMPISVR